MFSCSFLIKIWTVEEADAGRFICGLSFVNWEFGAFLVKIW